MKKNKRIVAIALAVIMASSLAGCGGLGKQTNKDFSNAKLMVKGYRDLSSDPYNKSYSIGGKKFMEKYKGSKVEYAVGGQTGGAADLVAAVNSGEPWNVQLIVGVVVPTVFQNQLYEPIESYIDMKSPEFDKKYMDQAVKYLGKTYAASNAIMSDFQYAAYNESLFKDLNIKTPAEYNAEGTWGRESMLKVIDDLKRNGVKVGLNFDKPGNGVNYAVTFDDKGLAKLIIDQKDSRDWVEWFRTILYDKKVQPNTKGIGYVSKREVGFKMDILPHILIQESGKSQDTIRYINFPNNPNGVYAVDYHFGLPKGAKEKEASGELIKMMVEACIEDRTNMYKQGMNEEDYKIFEKMALQNWYVLRGVAGVGYGSLSNDLIAGKPVSQVISENIDACKVAVEKYNAEQTKLNESMKK